MNQPEMTSLERVLTTLSHKEPDRVPLFLFLTMHGAKELGLTIQSYFSKAEHVVEGQLRLREKYNNDCIYNFFYAPIETEAWGGEVIYNESGPPNSGQPVIQNAEQIRTIEPPDVTTSSCLSKVIKSAALLKEKIGNDAPIIGVVMSPFSLPVMQMGFEAYLDLIHEQPELFDILMAKNQKFCINWANAQLKAGATAICYFDPVSSPTIIPRELYLKTGFQVAQETISAIQGPTATHLASGRSLSIIDDLAQTGTAIVGTSTLEDLTELKSASRKKLTILGNLNGIDMRHWTPGIAETHVKEAIAKAGHGGGFILSDNHGEIPFQVPDDTLLAISEAVQKWGCYPIEWSKANA